LQKIRQNKKAIDRPADRVLCLQCPNKMPLSVRTRSYSGSNISFVTAQTGHIQSSGMSSKAVPGATPESGSPTAGSYTYPQTVHTYFITLFHPLIDKKSPVHLWIPLDAFILSHIIFLFFFIATSKETQFAA
jgi:hypothetical protein